MHPDYLLRNKTVERMQAIWNPPSFDGHVSIAVGYLRDGQYEMALDKLEELHKTGIAIPIWLYDIYIYTLGEIGVHEEALMIMQHRMQRSSASIPHNIWYFLLETFSRDGFYHGIKYLWNRVVVSGKVAPSDGATTNILNTASRNADADLAMQVVKYLSNRGVKLGMHHFEALLEIQAGNNDLERAFSTMCLMSKADLHPDRSSARSILAHLQSSPEQIDEALAMLHTLKKSFDVPIAAFNVVLEATLLHRNFKVGLDLYRSVHQVCVGGPNLETFGLLLQHCTLHKTMRFLLAEMDQFSIEPNEAVYDRIIFISTLNPNYEPAFRYLEQMKSSKTEGRSNNWWISRGTALALLRRSIAAEDKRTQTLIADCKARGSILDTDIDVLVSAARRRRQVRQGQTALPAQEPNTQTAPELTTPELTAETVAA